MGAYLAGLATPPRPKGPRPVGTSFIEDPHGDFVCRQDHRPAYREPSGEIKDLPCLPRAQSLDIRSVRLSSDGRDLRVTFGLAGQMPDDVKDVSFSISFSRGGTELYSVGAAHLESRWAVAATDPAAGDESVRSYEALYCNPKEQCDYVGDFGRGPLSRGRLSASRRSLQITIPLRTLPRLYYSAEWVALVTKENRLRLHGGELTSDPYSDRVPDEGTAFFPQRAAPAPRL